MKNVGTKTRLQVDIRHLISSDYSEVLDIESASFEFPWDTADLASYLRQRSNVGWVAEHEERIVGFMICEIHETRMDILKLAVAPQYRRFGIGTQMVDKLVTLLSRKKRTRLTIIVRETSLSAQLFFRAQGFRGTLVYPGFFKDSEEDGFGMVYRVQT